MLGKRGYGYDTHNIIKALSQVLGLGLDESIILIGVGNLGSAILKYNKWKYTVGKIVRAYDLDENIVNASNDLGANDWQTFTKVIFPLSLNGVRSGVQSVFIPSLSLFMLTRLIGGNRVITLGTAIEQHFLTTQNWGMGATIGVVLIVAMIATMWLTKERRQ